MRESNLHEYDLSLLAVSCNLILLFELCQFDETFNVFYLYSVKLSKRFCEDYFARSLPASTPAAISISAIWRISCFIACVAWRFLSNLRLLGKRESRDKKRQSRREPGKETTEKPPAWMADIFC